MQIIPRSVAFVAALLLFVAVGATTAHAQGNPLDQARAAVADGDFTNAAHLYDQALAAAPTDKTVLEEAGDVNMELDRYDVARALYERAVAADKKDVSATRKLGLALSQLGRNTEAVAMEQRALSLDNSLDNYMALSHVYIASGKDSLSKGELTAMTAKDKFSKAYQPYVALGDLYYARGVYELAVNQYEEALKRDSQLIEPRVKLAHAYREEAKQAPDLESAQPLYTKALQQFNKVTIIDPRNARAWLEQGEILMLAHQYQAAGQSFETYVKLRPEDPRGDISLARAAYAGTFYTAAVPPLERIMAKTDSVTLLFQPQAKAMLAKSYFASKNYAGASKTYAIVPDSLMDAEALNFYGSSLMQSGDTATALNIYRKLVALKPDNCDMSLSLANLLYRVKRYDEVVDVLTKRLASCPTAPAATPYLLIGLSNFSLKHYDPAIDALSHAVGADSSSFQAWYWLMNAYAANKQFNKAADVARLMTKREFKDPTSKDVVSGMSIGHFFMGLEPFNAKNYKAAIAEFDEATKVKPDYVNGYLYKAFAYQSLQNKEQACANYKLVLKYDPNNADAKKNMKALGCE